MRDYSDIFRNCLRVRREGGVYFPVRFTQKLFAFYRSTGSAQFPERALQTAGVTLEFYTSQDQISFEFFFTCFARDWIAFDVYEDDVFTETVRFGDRVSQGTFTYRRRNREESRLVIYMPATADTHLKNFDLGDYRTVEKPSKKYLALGCSITQGMEAVSPSITYANIVKRHLDAEILNLGIGGFVYDPGSLDEELPYNPDVITVAYGTNDTAGDSSAEEIGEKISMYMEKLARIYPGRPVNVITPLWRAEYDSSRAFREKAKTVRRFIAAEGEKQGFHIIDGRKAAPSQPAYFKDGFLHPNELGFALYGLYVIKHLKVD